MATAMEDTNERVEGKLDRALLFNQRVKDLSTLQQILNVLELMPGDGLDGTDRRSLVRNLINYLNDPEMIKQIPDIEIKLDMINSLCSRCFEKEREKRKSEEQIDKDVKLRPGMEHIDIPGMGRTFREEGRGAGDLLGLDKEFRNEPGFSLQDLAPGLIGTDDSSRPNYGLPREF